MTTLTLKIKHLGSERLCDLPKVKRQGEAALGFRPVPPGSTTWLLTTLHKKEKNLFVFFPSHTAFFTIAQNCYQSKQPKYLLLGGWIIKLLDIHIEELYTSIKERIRKEMKERCEVCFPKHPLQFSVSAIDYQT